MFTDASLQGWGVTLHNSPAQGHWTLQEAQLPINVLKLRAIRLALLHFQDQILHLPVLICTDNISAKAYINNQDGSRSAALQREVTELLN